MITLGLVANVDTDGVYVSMPGSRGVLRGPYETVQNVTAGDKVLMVTTDDGDNVIVGLAGASVPGVTIADGSITSAKIANGTIVDEDINASAAITKTKISGTAITAADNGTVTSAMIADGTIVNGDISGSAAIDKTKISGTAITAADTGTVTNAMLAGSIAPSKITGTAITAADSGTVTSAMIANGAITNDDINASAAIARSKISGLPTSSTDNTLPRFDSTGGALQTSGIVVDDNNRLRVASGSSGGLEIGSSGVLALSYTGDPSGVSAPVGSTWRQTDANSTYGNLTGLLWNKVGTGTTLGTDWLVNFEGRWVSYTPTLTCSTSNPTATITYAGYYTRSGKLCHVKGTVTMGASGGATPYGAGTYRIALPANASTAIADIALGGSVFAWDSSASVGSTIAQAYAAAASYFQLFQADTAPVTYSNTAPWTWASGDYMRFAFTYEIA